jgi:hypothetical protein
MIDDGDCGAANGMIIGRGNRNTRRKPATVPLLPQQIPHDLTWFPLPIFIPPIAPQSPSPIIWGWYNRPEVAAVPSGLSLTPKSNNKKNNSFSLRCGNNSLISKTNSVFER